MIAYESNETSTPSIEVSFPSDSVSQSKEIAEDDSVDPTMDVEVVTLRRSARDRKQTRLFGNPWLYRITYNLTPKVLSDLLHHVPDTQDANGLFFFLCWMLFALFAGFLASFVVRSLRLFWGMVVRGFARWNLC